MTRKIILFLLIAASLIFTACQKDTDLFVPDPGQLSGPDVNWYSLITPTMSVSSLKNNLVLTPYVDSIVVNGSNAYITTPSGLQCGFPPNSCVTATGQVVTGTVKVELMLLKKKGDMVYMNKPTTSTNRLLVSGGEVFIRLRKDTQELQLAQNVKLMLRIPADLPANAQVKLFFGDESNPEKFNWLPNTDNVNNTVAAGTTFYEIQTNHLRWINCAYLFDTTGIPQTTITATLDQQFTNANTLAYTVFKDQRSVVGMYGDNSSRKFTSSLLPVGKEVTVVVISKQGNDYFMDHKTTITTSPTPTPGNQAITVKPVITTLANIKTYLNSL